LLGINRDCKEGLKKIKIITTNGKSGVLQMEDGHQLQLHKTYADFIFFLFLADQVLGLLP